MEVQMVTVKKESEQVCHLCQEDLLPVAETQGHVPQCQGCKNLFLDPQSWLSGNQEILCHSTERPYCCSFCPKRFKRASDRRDHERVHTGERPYGCSICGKRFTQSSVLSGHMRIHTGERPFLCGVCLKSFNNSSNFRKHQRIHGQLLGWNKRGGLTKDCGFLLGKEGSQAAGRQNGCHLQGSVLPKQNGCPAIKELRASENKSQDFQGRQNIPYCNKICQDGSCSKGLRRPFDKADHLKIMEFKWNDTKSGIDLQMKQSLSDLSLKQAVNSEGHLGSLGANDNIDGSEITENGHCFQQVTCVSGEYYTKTRRPNRESHTLGNPNQCVERHDRKLQPDDNSSGNGILLVGSNGAYIHKLSPEGKVRGSLARKTNGGFFRGLKYENAGSVVPNGRGGSHFSGQNPSNAEIRQDGNLRDAANSLRQNGTSLHFGSMSEEKEVDFQACVTENMNTLVPKMSPWTCSNGNTVLAWKGPSIGVMKEKIELEGCSPSDLPTWELDSPEPRSLPHNASETSRHHSLLDQFGSMSQSWKEESSEPCFSFHEPEPCDHHSSTINSKPFLCFACPKQFRRATDLKEHLRVHTGERPFGCGVCGKRFTQSSALATHRRLHTGEKPFECAVCYRRFNNSSNFAKHRRLHGQEGVRHGSKIAEKERWCVKQH